MIRKVFDDKLLMKKRPYGYFVTTDVLPPDVSSLRTFGRDVLSPVVLSVNLMLGPVRGCEFRLNQVTKGLL